MKENYIVPKAEIICFAPEENLAFDEAVSFLGWDITGTQDGNWNNWDKWFG